MVGAGDGDAIDAPHLQLPPTRTRSHHEAAREHAGRRRGRRGPAVHTPWSAFVSCAGQAAAALASTARRMSSVAASGWETNETCEAGTSTIVAFARSAMNRWSAGGIAVSSVPSKYQHGRVFHAGGLDGAPANAAAAYGRCA